MKIKRILSSALVLVMLLTAFMAAIPVSASAEGAVRGTVSIATDRLTKADQIKPLLDGEDGYVNYNFAPIEAFEYEKAQGFLDSVKYSDNDYKSAVYVNRYTGLTYFFDSYGKLYTSNPTNPKYAGSSFDEKGNGGILSQLEVIYSNQNDINEVNKSFYGLEWLLDGALIKVEKYTEGNTNGLKVTYHLGESTDFFIAPGIALADDFHDVIFGELADKLEETLKASLGEEEIDLDYTVEQKFWGGNKRDENNKVVKDEHGKIVWESYLTSFNFMELEFAKYSYKLGREETKTDYFNTTVLGSKALNAYLNYAAGKLGGTDSAEYKAINTLITNIKTVVQSYEIQVPAEWEVLNKATYEKLCGDSSAFANGDTIYGFTNYDLGNVRLVNNAMRSIFGDDKYEEADIVSLERDAGFNHPGFPTASFDISIIYTVNEKGELDVDVPANSIVYDKEKYMLNSVTPLKYFGASDMSRDGYIFFPDGSGAIAEFDDFYFDKSTNLDSIELSVKASVYGQDFAYDSIDKSQRHSQQITMPVFGMVNTAESGYKSGFFSIIEEGSALATIGYGSGKNKHKYAYTYASFNIHPTDSFDLTESYSVSDLKTYTVASKDTYVGNIAIKIVPLLDSEYAAANAITSYYEASYVGMANRYREHLKATGAIDSLVDATKQLPLYIEAFGSIDVTKRILTFPVTVSESLTTFDDIETMYNELADAKGTLTKKAQALRAEAAELDEKEVEEKASLEARAKEYDALAAQVDNILNVNFRLTGFANGGMYFSYPSKAKWEKKVGGKRGFRDLLEKSDAVASGDNAKANLGIYPDFDFTYINNTAAFDGISKNRDAARMIDNRYASKQVYNSISGEFESLFALLVNTDSLGKLYEKFDKKYSKNFEDSSVKNLSVSTLGSDLNSNFNKESFIDRETALGNVSALLKEMSESYSLMTDKGNVYALEFVDHVLNAPIDSSHFDHSSYAVPFYGMVLHGYVSYAGTPLNYSGSPDYDILRAIENGASLYYILCYQTENLSYLKEDENLSKYYGIDYKNWFDYIVKQYTTVNNAIGGLQDYVISNHEVLLSERSISAEELLEDNRELVFEYVEAVDSCLSNVVDKAIKTSGVGAEKLNLTVDKAGLAAAICDLIGEEELPEYAATALYAVIAEYETYYKNDDGTVPVAFGAADVVYESLYAYKTDSVCTDKSYAHTDYTSDNGNVVRVTYTKYDADGSAVDTVKFILNYNTYAVDVRLAAGEAPKTIESYGYIVE